ncbi:MAG: hypothetical protein WA705_13700 [Candidatus Ozemobacteraceae bacterium]
MNTIEDAFQAIVASVPQGGGIPYHLGEKASSEPSLLSFLAFCAHGRADDPPARQLVTWAQKNKNPNGSIAAIPEFPDQGIWLSAHLALVFHHAKVMEDRDRTVETLLELRSCTPEQNPNANQDNSLVGWPWAKETFGWVEPTSWAILALRAAGKTSHQRVKQGTDLLMNRCISTGGWNYGNREVYCRKLLPFLDTTALALIALADLVTPDRLSPSLTLVENMASEEFSLYGFSFALLTLERFGRPSDKIREAVLSCLETATSDSPNFAQLALALIALGPRKVLWEP